MWQHLFREFGLVERNGDLSAMAVGAAQSMKLRQRVHNGGSPGWVRAALTSNSSLNGFVRRVRRELEYKGAGRVAATSAA